MWKKCYQEFLIRIILEDKLIKRYVRSGYCQNLIIKFLHSFVRVFSKFFVFVSMKILFFALNRGKYWRRHSKLINFIFNHWSKVHFYCFYLVKGSFTLVRCLFNKTWIADGHHAELLLNIVTLCPGLWVCALVTLFF